MSAEANRDEVRQAKDRKSISAQVVYEAIRQEGEEELRRPPSALAWSGLAAGLSMGFSMLAEGLILHHLPEAQWRPLLSSFGYSLGFVIVILGRQQLFTENTLLPVLPLLQDPAMPKLLVVLRLWLVVLVANIAGTILFALTMAGSNVVSGEVQGAFEAMAQEAMNGGVGVRLVQAIFAGWLIALVVWLLPFAGQARIVVIVLLTYVISLAGFPHIIAGSVEVVYLVVAGKLSWWAFLANYFSPTLLGNTLGGVTLVALINYAQVAPASTSVDGR